MTAWPKHADGSPMMLGEMSPTQRRAMIKLAAQKAGIFFKRPDVQEQVAAIMDCATDRRQIQ